MTGRGQQLQAAGARGADGADVVGQVVELEGLALRRRRVGGDGLPQHDVPGVGDGVQDQEAPPLAEAGARGVGGIAQRPVDDGWIDRPVVVVADHPSTVDHVLEFHRGEHA